MPNPSLIILPILVAATWIDLRHNRIPNVLTIGGLGFAFLWRVCAGNEFAGTLLFGLAGAGIGFACLFPAYLVGGMGAGDVKMMTAVGAFLGPEIAVHAVVGTLITGGVLAFIVLWVNSRSGQFAAIASGIKFPYGGAILAGTTYALWTNGLLGAALSHGIKFG
jgi:prepilin peptidase CpaA